MFSHQMQPQIDNAERYLLPRNWSTSQDSWREIDSMREEYIENIATDHLL